MAEKTNRSFWMGLCLIVFVAGIVRYCFGDYLTLEGDDESYYLASKFILEKKSLYAGALALRDIYSFRWLSTWLTALSWDLFGESIASLTLFQFISSVASTVLTVFLAKRYLSYTGALLAGLLAAFNPMGIQLTMTLSPDSLLSLFSVLTLFLLLDSRKRFAVAGGVFCLSYLTKEESAKHLLPLCVMILALEWESSDRIRRAVKNIVRFGLPIVLVILIDILICWNVFGSPWARVQAALDNIQMWKRMGMVDPFGRPWSYGFYIRRLLFPFGPFGFLFYPALVGFFLFLRDRKDRALSIWFITQLTVCVLGTRFGQIQERMLQVLIPASSLFAAYALMRFPYFQKYAPVRWVVMTIAVLGSTYVVLCKYDLRWNASPRVNDVCHELNERKIAPIYVTEDIRFHMRELALPYRSEDLPDLSSLETATSPTYVVIRYKKQFPNHLISRVIYRSSPHLGPFAFLVRPIREYRKEYAPYQIVEVRRK